MQLYFPVDNICADMNTKVNNAYFLIPVFYLLVIVFLLYMQFSGTSSFHAEVSDITINGEKQAGAPGKNDTITDLSILYNDLIFSFGEETPALVFSQDGLTHSTVPEDYRVTASGIDIKLSKGLSVSFYRRQCNDESLNISVAMDDPASIKYVSLPISSEESRFEATEGMSVLSIKSEKQKNFFLSIPNKGYYDEQSGSVIIYPDSDGSLELVLERTAGSGLDAFTYWANGDADLISYEELSVTIDRYISNASDSLLGSRYNSTRGSWTMGDGSSNFDENALIMASVENIGKSSYRAALSQLNRAAASHSRDLSILSSALFGNIVNEGWNYDQQLQTKTKTLTSLSQQGDYSVFSDPDLVAAVLTENSDELIRLLSALTDQAPESEINLSDALNILSFYSSIVEIYPDIASRYSSALKLIESHILPNVRILGNRVYLSESGESADILQTLTVGSLLRNRINTEGDQDLSDLGRELVSSALLLSDNTGFIPAKLTFSEDGESTTEGIITPESIYPLLTDNPYYPAADYFFEETGEKVSVLNQAGKFNMEKTDYGYRMTFDFPPGQAHAFAVRNFKPFNHMNLLGYRWNSDHRFLTYSSGWWYDRQNSTLFIKVTHRMRTEEVQIYTEAPPAPKPAPETTTDTENATEEPGSTAAASGE